MEYPKSRVYNCFLENPEHPKSDACKNLVNTYGSEALYNWNGINQANANDNHRFIIPDGKLCSGNNLKFIGLYAVLNVLASSKKSFMKNQLI